MTTPKGRPPNANDFLGTNIVEGGTGSSGINSFGGGAFFNTNKNIIKEPFENFKKWWNAKATEKALKKLKIQRKKQREEVDKELSSKVKVAQEGLEGFNKSMKEKNQADLAEYYRLKTDGRISVDPEVKKIIPTKTPEQYKLDLKKAKRKGEKKKDKKPSKSDFYHKKAEYQDYGLDEWNVGYQRSDAVDKKLARKGISFDFRYVNDKGSIQGQRDRQKFLDMGMTEDDLKHAHLMMDPEAVTNETFDAWFKSLPVGSRL